MNDRYLVFGAPDVREEDIEEVVATLRSGWIGTGPRVARFEEMFREYVGSRHAVAVNSCTAALHLSLLVAGVQAGDEVITSPMTFAATANAIVHAGGHPRFLDVRRETQNIDPDAVRRFLEEECTRDAATGTLLNRSTRRRVRALLPVHMCGRPCEMDELVTLASEYGLVLLEDAAHAVGAQHRGRPVGSIGDMTAFSFYVTKNVTTVEGGMVTTDDADLAARLKVLALHGMSADAWKRYSDEGFKHYEVVVPGFKSNLTDLQAALGLHQLARAEEVRRRRAEIWEAYDEAFGDLPVGLPTPEADGTRHARHLYTLMVDEARAGLTRDAFMTRLHAKGIGTGVHYRAVHLHPYYRELLALGEGAYPEAEWISERTVSIPLGSNLSEPDVARVISVVRQTLGA